MAKARKAPAPAAAIIEPVALIPLADLYIHPLNARSEPPAADIEALADSIGELGLLQNLAGFSDPGTPDAIGVVAGGRRLRALIRLSERDGRRLAETTVPVRLTDSEDTARLWASAENSAREALHPADEVRAYGRMAATGAEPDRIAKAFAVTVRHVRQRLRLAQMPDAVLDSLRANEITLDQAGALTDAQSDVDRLEELARIRDNPGHGAGPDAIRNRLAKETVSFSDRRAIYVGLDAYREAGGEVQESLFASDTRLHDEALLQELFLAKLTESAQAEKETTGWKWVEVCAESYVGWNLYDKMQRIYRVPVDLPEADLDELQALSDKAETAELTSTEQDRFEELEHRAEGDYQDGDIATSGIWLFVDRHGGLGIHGPYRRQEDDPSRASEAPEDIKVAAGKGESQALSASLVEDLQRIRLAALQIAVGDDSSLIWDLLGWHFSFYNHPYYAPLGLAVTRQTINPEKEEGLELPARLTGPDDARSVAESGSVEAFLKFRALSSIDKGKILDRAVARLVIGSRDYLPALAALCAPTVRAIWTPTASAFFSRLPVSRLDLIWTGLVPDELEPNHKKFCDLKKAEKAQLLHRLFNDTDFREAIGTSREINQRIDAWLPPELQWPEVEAREEGGAAA